MVKVTLKGVDPDSPVVDVPPGRTTLGRGPFLNCADKKVSRSHAILELTDSGEMFLISTHVNPCFYFQGKDDANPKTIKKDKSQKLNNGDVFSLLPGAYKYEVTIVGGDSAKTESTAKAEIVSNAKSKKPKSDSEEFEEEKDDDEEEVTPKKKGKATKGGRPARQVSSAKKPSKVSIDDYVDSEGWDSEDSDDYKPKKRGRARGSESESDWELELKKGKGKKSKYAETESESGSDWGKSKSKKPAKKKGKPAAKPSRRSGRTKGKKAASKRNRYDSDESEEEDDFDEEEPVAKKKSRSSPAKGGRGKKPAKG
ncbi:Aprataxin and PNK-like factor [Halotydeus destructor]|nr:Aprataxin and PNK-like factor [Halotydeus destructor]